jgi:vacuolar-type H+-ATPase subunit I/STV1
MASPVDPHQIKIRSAHLEASSTENSSRDDDYDRKLKDAQEELDRIHLQKVELERKKTELEEFSVQKRTFSNQQVETFDKLTSTLELIDVCLHEMHQETEDLEQCKKCFVSHLDKIQKINPETWNSDNQAEKLRKATETIEIAIDEYDQASTHFSEGRCGSIFGHAVKRSRSTNRNKPPSEFMANLRNGFAFNLPIFILGGAALFAYLVR